MRTNEPEETVFYEKGPVKITNSRFVAGSETLPIRNITSFRAVTKPPLRKRSRLWAALALFFTVLCILAAERRNWAGVLIQLPFVVGPAIAAHAAYKTELPTYWLLVSTAAGEQTACRSTDPAEIGRLQAALAHSVNSVSSK